MVMVVAVEVRVEFRLLLTSRQVRLYPVIYPFCSSGGGGYHTSVALCGKKVLLKQLTGGPAGTVEEGRVSHGK